MRRQQQQQQQMMVTMVGLADHTRQMSNENVVECVCERECCWPKAKVLNMNYYRCFILMNDCVWARVVCVCI